MQSKLARNKKNYEYSAPEVRPGQRPARAAAGFSQLSRFLSNAPSPASSPVEAG